MCVTDFSVSRGFFKFHLPHFAALLAPAVHRLLPPSVLPAGTSLPCQMENTSLAPQSDSNPRPPLSPSQASGLRKGRSRGWRGRARGSCSARLRPPASLCEQSRGTCPAAHPSAAWQPRPQGAFFFFAPLSSVPGPATSAPRCRAATRRLDFALARAASQGWEGTGGEAPEAESPRGRASRSSAPRDAAGSRRPLQPTAPPPEPPLPPVLPPSLARPGALAPGLPAFTPPPSPARPPASPGACAL